MPKSITILKLNKTEYISELLSLMKEYNLQAVEVTKRLREGKEVVLSVDDKFVDDFIRKLSNIAEYRIEENDRIIDGFGVLSITMIDIFFVIAIVEVLTNIIKIRDIVLQLSSNIQFSSLFVLLLKIFLVFVIIKGFVNNFSTTPVGRFYNIKIVGNIKRVSYTMMVPVVGFYMITSGYGKIFELIGLFFIIFFSVSIIKAHILFDMKFQYKGETI